MKLLFLLLPIMSFAQRQTKEFIAIAMTAGYSTKQCAVGEITVAAKLSEHVVWFPVSFKYHSTMNNPNTPVIIESKIGFKKSIFIPYIGVGYHKAGQDGKIEYKSATGFKIAYGLITQLPKNFIFTTTMSGNIFCVQIGKLLYH